MSASERRWSLRWHLWLSSVLLSFTALEAHALRSRGESATLSAHLRRTLGLHPRRRTCFAGQAFIAGVLGWLSAHLLTGRYPSPGWFDG